MQPNNVHGAGTAESGCQASAADAFQHPFRVIPRLDIKGPNLVKGVHLEGLRVLGKPEWFARHYYEAGADELLLIDVVASLYERNSLHDIIRRASGEIFVPLIVGGGIRTLDDIQAVLRAGADKVSLNTAAIRRPEIIREAARRFGSSTIVISIEAIRQPDGHYEAFTDNGRERTGIDALEWAAHVTNLGAGEILITSIDREGTGRGYDLDLVRQIADSVSIPVVACGGAGTINDVAAVAVEGHAQGACIASMLHYWLVRHHQMEGCYDEAINLAHLYRGQGFSRVDEISLPAVKRELAARNILVRPQEE